MDIAGATSATYVLAADLAGTLRVVVTATNAGGSTPATSAQTGAVLEAPLANSDPPSVAGSPEEGQMLSASAGTWTGHPTSFAYQWRDCDASGANCLDIAGATDATHVLQPSDVGSTLRVVVTATSAGGSAAAASQPTAVVTAAVAAPANVALPEVSGTAREGQTLTASVGDWTGSPTSFAYRWRDCDAGGSNCVDIAGATGATYLLKASDAGNTVRVVVTATNTGGSTAATSQQTAAVTGLPPSNTAAPSISGTPQVGQTLTASTGTWTGSPSSFAYQWRACDPSGTSCADIDGATDATYVPIPSGVGSTLRVVVTATNGGGSTAASSQQTGAVVGLPPSSTGLPSISGTAQEGQTLTASNGSWAGSPTSFSYRWRDCDVSGAGCVDIAGATAATFVLRASDVGSTVRVVVIATNDGGSTTETSAQTLAVLEASLSNSVLPSISGTAQQNQTLTASTGTWAGHPSSFAYQWRGCDASGSSCVDIAGAVDSTYVAQVGDVGQTLRVVVTATSPGGSTASATSQQTTPVTSAVGVPTNSVPPSISGTAQEGQTLTAAVGNWADATSFAYRWRACDASGNNCVDIADATGSTYLLKASDIGGTVRVVVTATNASGSTSATSVQSGSVLASVTPAASIPGGITCNASDPAITVHGPVMFSRDFQNVQYVIWRTDLLHWNGTTWEQAVAGPLMIGAATATTPASNWWSLETGADAGSASTMTQSFSAPGGGLWMATQEFYWFTLAPAFDSFDYVVATPATGPTAATGTFVCNLNP